MRPVYPKGARRKRIQGMVRLGAVITTTGELRNIEVLHGDPLLIDAAKRCYYTTCIINSKAVDIITNFDVDFTLNQ